MPYYNCSDKMLHFSTFSYFYLHKYLKINVILSNLKENILKFDMILEFDRFTFVICISLFSSYNYFRKMGHNQKLMGHSQKLKIIGPFVIKQDIWSFYALPVLLQRLSLSLSWR